MSELNLIFWAVVAFLLVAACVVFIGWEVFRWLEALTNKAVVEADEKRKVQTSALEDPETPFVVRPMEVAIDAPVVRRQKVLKLCHGCGGLIAWKVAHCPHCMGYNFDDSLEAVDAKIKEMGRMDVEWGN